MKSLKEATTETIGHFMETRPKWIILTEEDDVEDVFVYAYNVEHLDAYLILADNVMIDVSYYITGIDKHEN